jgi:hypothetical protein
MYTYHLVTMSSDEYGCEEFLYNTQKEALAGLRRLKAKAKELADGVEREIVYHGKVRR